MAGMSSGGKSRLNMSSPRASRPGRRNIRSGPLVKHHDDTIQVRRDDGIPGDGQNRVQINPQVIDVLAGLFFIGNISNYTDIVIFVMTSW